MNLAQVETTLARFLSPINTRVVMERSTRVLADPRKPRASEWPAYLRMVITSARMFLSDARLAELTRALEGGDADALGPQRPKPRDCSSSYEPYLAGAWTGTTEWDPATGYAMPVLSCFYPAPDDPAFLRMVSGDETAFVNAKRKGATSGDPCIKDSQCGFDHWCKQLKDKPEFACYPKGNPGDSCDATVQCKDYLGHKCDNGRCSPIGNCTMRCPLYKGCFRDNTTNACVEENVSQRAQWARCPHSMPFCKPAEGCFPDPVDNQCEGYVFIEEQTYSSCALECLP